VNEFADLSVVVTALQQLHLAYPSVQVQLVQQPFGDDLAMIRQGSAQLGILPEVQPLGHAFVSHGIGRQHLVAVAAPQHPLATKPQPIDSAELQGHLQIVWSRAEHQSSSQVLPLSQQQDLGVHSLDTWRVTELATKRQFILAGLGWGSLPIHLVRDDIAQGRLVELKLTSWEGRDRMPSFDICVCRLKQLRLGPAGKFLLGSLINSAR
jgi:DNA-binding transcriptional LysR family regulator